MFQSLRIGTPLYVLHKNEPKLEVGEVIFVSQPVNQFGQTIYQQGIMNPAPATVDIKIKSNDKTIELQKLPANMSIADYGNGMVISESRDSIINELGVLRQNSERIIASIDQHKDIVSKCDALMQELNPQVKQDAERQKEMLALGERVGGLGERVGGLEKSMQNIEGLLTQILDSKKEK